MSDLRAQITQYLVDKLREKTGTDYIYATTAVASLPAEVVQEAMVDAAEHFGSKRTCGTIADLAGVIHAAVDISNGD